MTDDARGATTTPEPHDGADVELLGLIDRLAELLERSDLSELEVESGGTGLILRKPVAIAAAPAAATVAAPQPTAGDAASTPGEPSTAGRDPAATARLLGCDRISGGRSVTDVRVTRAAICNPDA